MIFFICLLILCIFNNRKMLSTLIILIPISKKKYMVLDPVFLEFCSNLRQNHGHPRVAVKFDFMFTISSYLNIYVGISLQQFCIDSTRCLQILSYNEVCVGALAFRTRSITYIWCRNDYIIFCQQNSR